MRRLALTVSVGWGAILAFVLLGAGLDGSIGLIAYLSCVLAVWLFLFVVAWRRGPAATALALKAIPVSLLGPVAIALPGIRGLRRRPASTGDQQRPDPEPAPTPRRSEPSPALPPKRTARPGRSLAAMLAGSVAAFPVVGLALLMLLVLGGAHFVTARDMRGIALASGVVSGVAVLASAVVWWKRSRESSKRSQGLGWASIIAAAAIIAAGTLEFADGKSPKNLDRPTVSGSLTMGSVLTAEPGRWTTPGGPLTYDYQWQRCRPDCRDILGATHRTYALAAQDRGERIRVTVTADPTSGLTVFSSDWVASRETAPIRP